MDILEPLNDNPMAQENKVPEASAADQAVESRSAEPAADQAVESRSAEPEKPSKKIKPALIIGIAVAVALIVVLLSGKFSNAGSGSPVNKFMSGAENTAKAFSGAMTEQVSHATSVTLEADFSNARDMLAALVGMPISVDAKMALSVYAKEDSFAMSFDSRYQKTNLLDFLIVCNESDFAVSSEALLSNVNYGVSLKNFTKNLENSVFAPDQNTSLSLSKEEFDSLTEYFSLQQNRKDYEKDLNSLSQHLFDQLEASLEKHSTAAEGKETIRVAGQDFNTTLVTMELDAEALCAVAEDMLTYLKNDKEFKDFYERYYTSLPQAYGSTSFQDIEDAINEALNDLGSTKEDLKYRNAHVTIKGNLSGSNLLQVRAKVELDGKNNNGVFTLGPDPAKPQEISATIQDGDETYTMTYLVSRDDKSSYEASFSMDDGTSPVESTVKWDKKSGDMKMTMELSGYYSTQRVEIEANATESGKKTVFVPETVTFGEPDDWPNAQSIPLRGITLTVDRNAKIPTISKYTEVLTMSESELMALVEELQQSMEVISSLMDRF